MAEKKVLGLFGNGPRFAGMGAPDMSVESLYYTVVALKQNVEALTGQLGDQRKSQAVLFQDLIDLGLIDESQLPEGRGIPRKGS